jgi:hypothetical protein
MARRKGHGTGAGVPRDETLPWDEQRTPPAGGAGPLVRRNAKGQPATPADAAALARRPRRSAFVPRKLATDPRYEPHNRRRLDYLRRRRDEHYTAWGGVSHGVGAMLASAAWLWSAGEFASELGAESGDTEHFRTASNLYAQAKQLEAAAWELNEREARARPKAPVDLFAGVDRSAIVPWGSQSADKNEEPSE